MELELTSLARFMPPNKLKVQIPCGRINRKYGMMFMVTVHNTATCEKLKGLVHERASMHHGSNELYFYGILTLLEVDGAKTDNISLRVEGEVVINFRASVGAIADIRNNFC